MEQKILRLLIVALVSIVLLIFGLSVLFGLALRDVKNSVQTNKDSDIVAAIKSLKVVSGKDGLDGLSVPGPPGKDGKDSTSTIVIQQVPIKGDKGEKGEPAAPAKEPEFDGMGNWRFKGDEIWLPLFSQTPVAE